MKDPSSVLVNGDSTPPSSTLESEDDYVFTEDQRRAALELQSLYRKLGLEDLDDGFEEGLSAYDDPHFDIVARLHEVNTRFQEDETPLESDRHITVRFKETLVDLVVPISPVRSTFSPSDLDYADYDDEYDDDFETEELRNMMADDDLNHRDDDLNQRHSEEDEEDKPWLPLKPSAPPLLFLSSGDTREDEETSYEDDIIHIRAIADDDSDRSNSSSPEKMMKLETEHNPSTTTEGDALQTKIEQELPDKKEDDQILPGADTEVSLEVSNETETEDQNQVQELSVEQPDCPPVPEVPTTQPSEKISEIENEVLSVPYVLPMGAKPKKPYRMSSPPCKPRAGSKKSASLLPKQSVQVLDVRSNSVASTKCGNSRSQYGLTEELRQELKRLKQLEQAQKKLREHEMAEEKRKRQEEADSAFKAWLEMKRRSKASSPIPRKDTSRSPTRKMASPKKCATSPANPASSPPGGVRRSRRRRKRFNVVRHVSPESSSCSPTSTNSEQDISGVPRQHTLGSAGWSKTTSSRNSAHLKFRLWSRLMTLFIIVWCIYEEGFC